MQSSRLWSKNFILINLCVIFAYIYILPVHMLAIGGSNTDVGLMGTGLTLVGLVTRLTLAPLIDKWGRKNMLVPAHTQAACRDVTVRCIKFVLPESLDVSGITGGICNTRNFKARFIAHYIDNDFECCDALL